MPENHDHLEYLREKAALLRRLSREHAAVDNPLIGAKLAEVAGVLEARAATLERSSPRQEECPDDRLRNRVA
jgi:hypothetical protein